MPADNQHVDTLTKSTYAILERARTQEYFHGLPRNHANLDQYPPYLGENTVWYSLEGIIVGFGKVRPLEADKVTCDKNDLYSVRLCVDKDGISERLAQNIVCGGGDGGYYDLKNFNMEPTRIRHLPLPLHILVNDILPQIKEYRALQALKRAGVNVEASMGWLSQMSINPDDLAQRVEEMAEKRKAAQMGTQAFDAVERHQQEIHDANDARKRQAGSYVPDPRAQVGAREPIPTPAPTILNGMSALWAGIANYFRNFYK
jgi:hypothetical protein